MTEVSYARKTFGKFTSQQPSELQSKKGMTLVIGGRSNVGKTTLLNTIFDSKRIKTVGLVDARGRTHVLKDREGLYVFPMKSYSEWIEFLNQFKHDPNAFDVLVVDTYTEIQSMDLKHRGLYKAADKDRLAIYNDSHMDMSDQTRTLYDLATLYGVHIILTMWVKPGKDKKTDTDTTRLMLTPQFEEYFRGIVDYIGVLDLGNAPRTYPPVLSFTPTNTTPHKFSPNAQDAERMAKIPKTIYRPSLGEILDTFMGDEYPAAEHLRP